MEIPDEVRVYNLFTTLKASDGNRAQIITAAGGSQTWKPVTEALQLLYPEYLPFNRPPGRFPSSNASGNKSFRPRSMGSTTSGSGLSQSVLETGSL